MCQADGRFFPMSKVYVQKANTAWSFPTASLAGNASAVSGSFPCQGFARLTGTLVSNASLKAASGLRISQSGDSGSNWDYYTDFVPSACSGSAFSIELIGNAAKIEVFADSGSIGILRTNWVLRPV